MSVERYRVIAERHVHRGRELVMGDELSVPTRIARRYPEVFERVVSRPAPRATATAKRVRRKTGVTRLTNT